MTISALLDPAQMPDQSQDQLDFDNKMSGLMRDLPVWGAQVNATEAAISAFAAGGAYAFPYVFDNAITDADPGLGKLRLSSATQNAATVLRADALALGGANMMGIFDALSSVSSFIKGAVRIVKAGDPSKWLLFDVLSVASGSGYRNMTVAHRAGSSATPFTKDDALVVYIDRNGDAGILRGATQFLAEQVVTTPVAAIAFPDVFSDLYDLYMIDIVNVTGSVDASPLLQLYTSQAASAGTYAFGNTGSTLASTSTGAALSDAASGTVQGQVFVRGARTARGSSIIFDGYANSISSPAPRAIARRGILAATEINSGFAIRAAGGGQATITGTIRVYGVGK